MPSFIPDGYTTRGYIAPVPGLHDGLDFQFRPMLYDQRAAVQEQTRGQPSAKRCGILRAALLKHLVSWTSDKPLNADSLRHLQPSLFDRVYFMVEGSEIGDALPADASQAEQDEYTKSILETEESHRKN